jgi:dihydroorotate dehydrogenase
MNLWQLTRGALFCLPAERAHQLTVRALAMGAAMGAMGVPGLVPGGRTVADPRLAQTLWGKNFANPLGLAAGFDKDARVMAAVLGLGFGFTEVGTLTPRAQPGNPRPRLFRLSEDRAVINRLGFNNQGAPAAARRLKRFHARARSGVVGVNIGRNKTSTDAVADYADAARLLGPYADYLVLNVSSPNTPGLRELQGAGALAELVVAVRAARGPTAPPVLVKIAPDLSDALVADICALARAGGMDGLIISNTTIARPATLISAHKDEDGGLSGGPLMAPSTKLLAEIYAAVRGAVPLIGTGGVASADDAYAKIRAGASLVQLYTALVYEGPGLVDRVLTGLVDRLQGDGFANLTDAIGADHR